MRQACTTSQRKRPARKSAGSFWRVLWFAAQVLYKRESHLRCVVRVGLGPLSQKIVKYAFARKGGVSVGAVDPAKD